MAKGLKYKLKIIIPDEDKPRFEYLLEQFNYLFREVENSQPELSSNGKDYIYFLEFARTTQQQIIVEIIALNGFQIETNNEKVQSIIKRINRKISNEPLHITREDYDFNRDVDKTYAELSELVLKGAYNELIKLSKDITYSPQTRQSATSNIQTAVSNSIMKIINDIASYKLDNQKGIKELLQIASDIRLKNYNCKELMIQAANIAFELCIKRTELVTQLIEITNQKKLDPVLNLKAAAKFAELTLSDKMQFRNQLKSAKREMNTRWLKNVIYSFGDLVDYTEIELIEDLIDYLQESRSFAQQSY